ncbi:tetrathionate reductase family octaheme c-type cytochrome [Aquicoccus sp. SU-CL01552]|uniref:tetrathionate reductase family octaheme c-type cytochrome n=1 Tax=Aquicoccus sp. SU-CL01552 TaxID=3127656 RepID=UPI003108B4E1
MPPRVLTAVAVALFLAATGALAQMSEAPGIPGTGSTADHSQFKILQQEFSSGPAVTEACVKCHTEADDQVMHSIHFTWEFEHPGTGQLLGKRNVINAFCGNVVGNEPRCTSCHAGYGWDNMNQSPQQESVTPDCLVCHDRSGEYTKSSTGAGMPPLAPVKPGTKTITGADAWPVDLSKAAQSVGMPGRENCGQCHFYGGGGDNVKHGDLSSVLFNPSRDVDVHMSPDGGNMVCSDCHVSDQHSWAGSRYDVMAADTKGPGMPHRRRDVATCQSCHGTEPHPVTLKGVKLNDHTDKLACQTCHIPEFARGGVATKMEWDWSTAGKMGADGKPLTREGYTQGDGKHRHTYLATKGDFVWEENVEPLYEWFNGQVEYTLSDETIDPSKVVEVNRITGDPADGNSRIWPFKRLDGRQAYDAGLNRLAYSHVWGPTTDSAFWTNFDWSKAIAAGMKAAGAEYSGEYGFVDTHMSWPITHMVAPAKDALDCAECHAADGRMDGIDGVYMPGRTPFSTAGVLGLALIAATALALGIHALGRIFTGKDGDAS